MNFVFTFIRLFCAFFIFVVIGGCVSHSTIYGDFIAGKSLSTPSGVLWFRSRDFISDAKTPLELSAINLPAKVDPMEISVGISGGTNTPHESSGIFKIEVPGVPTVDRIVARCEALDAFAKAAPSRQVGAPAA